MKKVEKKAAREKRNRSRSYYRDVRNKAIERKRRIIEDWHEDNPPSSIDVKETHLYLPGGTDGSWGASRIPGKLSKGKIHCSCKICRFSGCTISDIKRLDEMMYEVGGISPNENISNIGTFINSCKRAKTGVIIKTNGTRNTPPGEKYAGWEKIRESEE